MIDGRNKPWKSKDEKLMHQGLRKFGRNFTAIGEYMGKRDLWQVITKSKILRAYLIRRPDDENIDLLDILRKHRSCAKSWLKPMTEDEKDRIIEGYIAFGHEYDKIEQHLEASQSREIIRTYILDMTTVLKDSNWNLEEQ